MQDRMTNSTQVTTARPPKETPVVMVNPSRLAGVLNEDGDVPLSRDHSVPKLEVGRSMGGFHGHHHLHLDVLSGHGPGEEGVHLSVSHHVYNVLL
jgi:hypothetical protein